MQLGSQDELTLYLGEPLIPGTGVLVRSGKDTETGRGRGREDRADIGGICLRAKVCQGLGATARNGERQEGSSLRTSRGAPRHLLFRLAVRTVRDPISEVCKPPSVW